MSTAETANPWDALDTLVRAVRDSGRGDPRNVALAFLIENSPWSEIGQHDDRDIDAWLLRHKTTLGAEGMRAVRRAVTASRAQGEQDRRSAERSGRTEFPESDVVEMLQRTEPKDPHAEPKIRPTAWNLGTILRNDTRWRGRHRLNQLRGDEEVLEGDEWRPLKDVDDVSLTRWVSEVYGLEYRTGTAREQVALVATENRAHPVREYLAGLTWDGQPRLAHLLSDYFGAEHDELHASIGKAWMVAMVARVEDPGCKVDTVPILIGKQGTRKSSTLRAMVPDVSWFSDSDIPLHHAQDQYQVIRGKWLYEIAEFDRFASKADAAKVKAYVTQQVDSYRESYGRRTIDRARQVVFVGTTNAAEFLVDPSGARRFWPVKCGDCNPDAMTAIRDQLWAEAVHEYRSGSTWLLSQIQSEEVARIADEYRVADAWDGPVAEYLTGRFSVAVTDVLSSLEVPRQQQDQQQMNRVARILIRLGWTKSGQRQGAQGRGPRMWVAPAGWVTP
jgi:putative DNA primase/helicase